MKLVEILARELAEWPEGAETARQDKDREICFEGEACAKYDFFSERMAEDADIPSGYATGNRKITREMWEAERRKIKGQELFLTACANGMRETVPVSLEPDWSKAPEGYDYWIVDKQGIIPAGFHRLCPNGYYDQQGQHWTLNSTDVDIIPRPTQPQWRGPEDGLPPVGVVCENHDGATGKWSQVKIVAHHIDPGCAIFTETLSGGGLLYYGQAQDFRPNRTPRDKWIEAAAKIMHETYSNGGMYPEDQLKEDDARIYLAAIYDRGLAKLPGDGE